MTACAQCSVRDTAICQSLMPAELGEFSRMGRHRTLERGQAILWQGEQSLLVGNITDGVVKLSVATQDGQGQTLGVRYPSDFIGRPFGEITSHSVVAMTDASICTFPRAAFDGFAHTHPALEHTLLQRTLEELDRTQQWLVLLARKSARARIAAFLVEMSQRLSDHGSPPSPSLRFSLPFGRQDIADLLGLTIETVSRQITGLRKAGILETPNRRDFVVLDPEALAACAEEG